MPAERRFGMDHPHYQWSPISKRGVLGWPDNARLALCVIVNLEHFEFKAPEGSYQIPTLSGGLGNRPFPDYSRFTMREYGHRVGIFRVLDVLERHGIPATVAMDASTAENYPYLVRHCLDRGYEIIGHGVAVTQMISSKMSEQDEREYIQRSIASLTKATGISPVGWFSPEYGESSLTPQLLAEADLRYLCDWCNDEQPYPLTTPKGELFALPVMVELDDAVALWERRLTMERYGELLKESFDTLYEDSAHNGRILVLNLRPWLVGQPYRIKYLDHALEHIMQRQGVWAATGAKIIDWYRQNRPAA